MLSFVERSEKHIDEFGENKSILWKPDATAIVIMVYLYLILLSFYPLESNFF